MKVDLYDGERVVASGEVGELISVPACTITAVEVADQAVGGMTYKIDVRETPFDEPGVYTFDFRV